MAHICKVIGIGILNCFRDKKWRQNKLRYFLSYIHYSLKYLIYLKILRVPLHFESVNGYNLTFFHYSIFHSLFEDMFLNDEYYIPLPKKPHIIDLGSEVGISTTYFTLTYPRATILAFEPDPASYLLLCKNSKSNCMHHVRTFNLAVSNKEGIVPFYIDPLVDGALTMSLSLLRQKKKILVKVKKISQFITKKVNLLKIDIEGAELAVLQDLSKSHKIQHIDSLIIEYHHHIDNNSDNLSLLLNILEKEKFGYQIRAKYPLPFKKMYYQDFLIFAYKKA